MSGLIINGKTVQVPGLEIVNYYDHPELKLRAGEDMRERHTRWIRSVCWHNTKNIPTALKPGCGPNTDLEHRITRWWSKDGTHAGAHLCVDWDQTIGCMADLLQDATYHASSLNEVSIGGELYEDSKGVIYQAQISAAVRATIWMCQRFGIQRQIPAPGHNDVIDRVREGGEDCVGVFGHCHQYSGKPNDPGVHIFQALEKAGFRVFDFRADEDKDYWRDLQRKLGLKPDGIPGPKTRDALQARGFAYGLYDWQTAL
jgi:hypothetical protein